MPALFSIILTATQIVLAADSVPKFRSRADLPRGHSRRLAWARFGVMPARRASCAQPTRESVEPIQRSTAKRVRYPCHNRRRTKLCGAADLPRNDKASQGAARRFQDEESGWPPLIVYRRTRPSTDMDLEPSCFSSCAQPARLVAAWR